MDTTYTRPKGACERLEDFSTFNKIYENLHSFRAQSVIALSPNVPWTCLLKSRRRNPNLTALVEKFRRTSPRCQQPPNSSDNLIVTTSSDFACPREILTFKNQEQNTTSSCLYTILMKISRVETHETNHLTIYTCDVGSNKADLQIFQGRNFSDVAIFWVSW